MLDGKALEKIMQEIVIDEDKDQPNGGIQKKARRKRENYLKNSSRLKRILDERRKAASWLNLTT